MENILKPTPSIQKGLDDFGKEKCLEALRLHEECDYNAMTVAEELTSKHIAIHKTDFQLKQMGERMIKTGRWAKYTFNQ
jgi:hypothetical protein